MAGVNNADRVDVEYIKNEKLQVIKMLAVQSKKTKIASDSADEKTKDLYSRLDKLLDYLEGLQMAPKFKQETQIESSINLIHGTPGIQFPKEYVDRAKAVHGKWQAQNWGQSMIANEGGAALKRDSEDEVQDMPDAKRARMESVPKSKRTDVDDQALPEVPERDDIRRPSPHHPTWGVDGIMHGVALKKGTSKKTMVHNDMYPKREAHVFGNHGFQVGQWFPFQIVAWFRGAHGHQMAGISGTQETGAYSIVVSGMYDELDKDYGEYLYYSGSGSHGNKDPNRPPPSKSGTMALHTSIRTQKPVRVLRSSTGKSQYAPSEGMRYDGLYRVVSVSQPKNGHGGRFEQFKLVRLNDQPNIKTFIPRPDQKDDLAKVKNGFPKYREV